MTGSGQTNGHIAVVGGGLAGMAAALRLAENGSRVSLFEQKHRLGGRVGSFRDRITGDCVDFCMHVAMGCCTNFLDFIRRTGVEDCFTRHHRLTFIGPTGKPCKFDSWPLLPAPLHLLPGFAGLSYLTLRERVGIGRCLMRLGRLTSDNCRGRTTAQWLHEQGQSDRTIERFWSVVLVSALGETVDRADLSMARKVFLDGFMRSLHGYEVLVPTIPLGEIFADRVPGRLTKLGVELHTATRIRAIDTTEGQTPSLTLAGKKWLDFDAIVVAVPWTSIGRIIPSQHRSHVLSNWSPGRLESRAITAVHLWFDREITSLPHAAFVGRTSHWIFRHGQSYDPTTRSEHTYRYQVVISASQHPSDQLLEEVLCDLRTAFPKAATAQLLHHRTVTEPNAVFSVTPEGQQNRPPCKTRAPNIYLAGDWTDTDWPATMEGAILSGYKAALAALGNRKPPLSALKPGWLARLLFQDR